MPRSKLSKARLPRIVTWSAVTARMPFRGMPTTVKPATSTQLAPSRLMPSGVSGFCVTTCAPGSARKRIGAAAVPEARRSNPA